MTSSKKAASLNLQTTSTVAVICPKPYEQKRFTLSRLNKNKNKDPVAEKAARKLEEELIRGMENGQLVKLVLLSPQHVSTSALIFATYRFINCELNGTN